MKFSPDSIPDDFPQPVKINLLELQNQLKTQQLELQEQQKQVILLRQELDRLRQNQKGLLKESSDILLEGLYSQLAPAIVQLITQDYLVMDQNKTIDAKEILKVDERLISSLVQNGLEVYEQPGQQVSFDPNSHSALSTANAPQPGQAVIIRFVGLSFHGKIIRKAGVEKLERTE